MCDDLTRQEILFFTVMHTHQDGLSEDAILDGMSKLAIDIGWPSYLDAVPRSLSERLKEARDRSMIFKVRPLYWKPAPGVAAYVRYLAERYLEKPSQREMILELLDDELHAAE
ncbi:hypothetical protein EGN72_01575 [Pseudorhodobacter sp. E13]|uniref:hypothetical protein n=1 Tax=Pseudorhodobacter sp. E13 TaxID=2487931 RepID=UPI000F8E0CE4|nr:hypothetical protein [Pseudorhodobacter sp. E13]RUS65070.1 hypothetical protein EGN72_01575 [Pseudorhodobacter sp. E13]